MTNENTKLTEGIIQERLICVFEDLRRHPSVIKKAPLLHKDKLKINYESLSRKLAYRLCEAQFDRDDAIKAREKYVNKVFELQSELHKLNKSITVVEYTR